MNNDPETVPADVSFTHQTYNYVIAKSVKENKSVDAVVNEIVRSQGPKLRKQRVQNSPEVRSK